MKVRRQPAGTGAGGEKTEAAGSSPRLSRADFSIAVVLGCGLLALYLVTLCRTIYVEDAAEFTVAAAVWGVAHPPGYPLYTMLAGSFVRGARVGDVAYRSNLFSAVSAALAVASLWLLLRRLRIGAPAALSAALCFGLGSTFWSLSLVAEVHALNCLLLVLAIGAAFWAAEVKSGSGSGSSGLFAAFGLLVGLLIGHRNLNLLFVLPLVLFLELARRRARGPFSLWAYAMAACLAAGLVYLYLPLAAARAPALNVGAPSTFARFVEVVTARVYVRHLGTGGTEQNLHRAMSFLARLPAELGIASLALPVGAVHWYRRQERQERRDRQERDAKIDRSYFLPLAVISLACAAFASMYNVIDVDAYFLPAIVCLTIVGAIGLDALPLPPPLRLALPALALLLLPVHFRQHDLRDVDVADRYGRDLLHAAPPHAVVMSVGDTSRNVILYRQAVLAERPDVAVVAVEQLSAPYLDERRRRHPHIKWPDLAGSGLDWISSFVERNAAERPVCLTLPLNLGLQDWRELPQGLLSCFEPRAEPLQLARALEPWHTAEPPTAAELVISDVHLHMVALSYAAARFSLARALVDAGDIEQARVQLRAVLASDPDRSESLIHQAKATIGQTSRGFSYGQRAKKALALATDDRTALSKLLAGEVSP